MKVISIDLDNTLYLNKAVIKKIFEKHEIPYYPTKRWDLNDYPEKIRNDIFELFSQKTFVEQPLIEEDIGKLLFEVSKIYDVKFVSSRDASLFLATARKMLIEFPEFFTIDRLFFSKNKKSSILKYVDLETHFDDSPEVIEDLKNNKVNYTMISNSDTLYNHDLRKDNPYVEKLSDGLIQILNKHR